MKRQEIFLLTKQWAVRVTVLGALMGTMSGAGAAETLLVANQKEQTLAIVDTAAGHVVASIPVGGVTGHEVAVSPDGTRAFVPIYGDAGVGRPGTNGDRISVI